MQRDHRVDQFLPAHDFPRFVGTPQVLFLAFTPRSGSHLLGHTLHETGLFGFPLDYLHPANLPEWQRRLGTADRDATLAELQGRRTSPNGVFGIKMAFPRLLENGGPQFLRTCFPEARYVVVRRRDVIAQAVSFARSRQTGVWIEGQAPKTTELTYDPQLIDRCLRQVLRDASSWSYVISRLGAPSIEVAFEDLVRDPVGVLQSVAGLVNVDLPAARIPTTFPISKQDGSLADDWKQRFQAEAGSSLLFASGRQGARPLHHRIAHRTAATLKRR